MPDSVIGFLAGELGDPPGGWPEPFRTKALEGRRRPSRRHAELTDDRRGGAGRPTAGATLNRLLFPGPTKEFARSRGDLRRHLGARHAATTSTACGRATSTRSSSSAGVRLLLGLEAIGDADERGMRTVMCTLNGQLRPVSVRDRVGRRRRPGRREGRPRPSRATSPPRSPAWSPSRSPRATRSRPGQTVATIEAMKMEAAITAPVAGTVERLAIGPHQQVEGGDLLVVVERAG